MMLKKTPVPVVQSSKLNLELLVMKNILKTLSYNKKINLLTGLIWIFGSVIVIIFKYMFSKESPWDLQTLHSHLIWTLLILIYFSLPFGVLAIIFKLLLKRSNLSKGVLFMRSFGVLGAFIAIEWFNYIYEHAANQSPAEMMIFAMYLFVPILSIGILPFGYFVGATIAYIIMSVGRTEKHDKTRES